MEVRRRVPCSSTASISRVSGAVACVRKCDAMGDIIPPGRSAYFRAPVAAPAAVLPDCWIWPDSCLTLGGLVALPAGEWAPEVSSGFCSGALYANGPGSMQGGGGADATGVPDAAAAGGVVFG